ncbi:MAG: LPS assembly lipoprotein LptE [Acidobacteria bacterium]|nr:LPS assembly lipoprotein LptE [Acidobacteriota bacterium]
MRTFLKIVIITVLAAHTAACGYTLAGRGSFLPAYIKTVGIPEFTNATPYFEVEQLFTDKIRSELIGRGKYQVLPQRTGVDALLRGSIASMTITPANFNQQQQATRFVITITTSIELVDLKTNKNLWENPSMVFREEYDLPADQQAGDAAAFFGQSSNALQRVATDFARTVISSILEAF